MDAVNQFVLDGSITLVWGFDDEADAYAESTLDLIPGMRTFMPSVWPLEVANALLVGERRGRTSAADAARFLAILATFPIAVDPGTAAHAWHETMHLARAHGLSVYDDAYLELAIRLGLPLATLDAKLKSAASACRWPPSMPSSSPPPSR